MALHQAGRNQSLKKSGCDLLTTTFSARKEKPVMEQQSLSIKSIMKHLVSILCISLVTLIFCSSAAHAEWSFGIGTGLSFNNIDGKQGFTTQLGPVKYDVKLDPQDFSDFVKTAFGFEGYATDDTWLIQYSLAYVELEDKESTFVPPANSTITTKINFRTSGAELTAGYPVYKTSSLIILVDGGVRYTKHELDNKITISGAVNAQAGRKFDHDWTDAVLGAMINVPFAQTWSWNNRLNAGFGGSDGTYLVSSEVRWRFHKYWSASIKGKYVSVKYENASEGDSDWYFYDADESSIGLLVFFNW